MPFLAGIGKLAVAATERRFRWQKHFLLYGAFNCCGNHDKTLNVIFRPLRVVG
jgi:hypothetical protein